MKKLLILIALFGIAFAQQKHPNMILTSDEVAEIKNNIKSYPVFEKTFNDIRNSVDKTLMLPIDVPVPADAAAYTHERHKKNYTEMYQAGIIYQFTGEKKYAEFIKKMLLKYADLYPTLKQHPKAASESPGRLFWQSLNEYVWMVHTSQAYDCIYDYLKPEDRQKIENNVFRKMAEFFTTERVHELDLIHNHGTWSCAAVGMAGMILNDKDLIEKALYGSEKKKEGGFIKQLETLFSPDGYYTEGAYYVRYALMPFFVFSEALNNYMPELKIYEFRNQILKKGLYSALQLTYTNGAFIPINDALKDKNYLSPEIAIAVDLAYKYFGRDETLLNIAKKQNTVMMNGAGLLVAKALSEKASFPEFIYKSVNYSDGANGDEGGISILRSGPFNDQSLLLMKYTAHGLSHGHYDKLSFLYYDQGREVIQDYGSARFVNVEPKWGGRYLPENKSYAMTTIAHNTVTVDEISHFGGKIRESEKYHSDFHFVSLGDSDLQITSAKDEHASSGVKMQRTMAMIKDPAFIKPIIVDIFKLNSSQQHQYDLPYYYMGHLMNTNTEYTAYDQSRTALGKKNGYQHLWKEAETTGKGVFQLTWMTGERFYTLTSAADSLTKIIMTRIGAGDPKFNLRNDPGIMLRYNGTNHVFASVIEPHGTYDPVREFCSGASGIIEEVKIIGSNEIGTVVSIKGKNKINWILMINNGNASETEEHTVSFGNDKYQWKGNFKLVKN